MASKRPSLEVAPRESYGSRATRRLRRSGFVPGIVYGGGDGEALSFQVNARDLRHVLVGAGALIDLTLDGDARPVIVKDAQLHPVRGEVMHIDFLQVRLDEKIHTQVAVHLEGIDDSPGVKEGGVMEQATHQLNIEVLPTEIPEQITVDVSGMEIAATMHLSEISAPSGVTFLDDLEETILATIVVPAEEPEEPEVEEEPELVGEDGVPVTAAEGATGDEAEQAAEAEPSDDNS